MQKLVVVYLPKFLLQVPKLYMSEEVLAAIYVPLMLPVVLAILLGIVMEVKRYRELQKSKTKAGAR